MSWSSTMRPSIAASTPTGATGRRRSSRAFRAIRSANGSMRTATATTTCSKSRPATSRARAPRPDRHADPCRQPVDRQGAHLLRQGRSGELLHDEITLIDHAFTRPWTVLKTYRRDPGKYPIHAEEDCAAATANMLIGNELYYLSADRELMPTRKDQPPPDLSVFQGGRPVAVWQSGGRPLVGRIRTETTMRYRSGVSRLLSGFAVLACARVTASEGRAWDESKYPDLKASGARIGDPTRFDRARVRGLAQQAPLTPEYQALFGRASRIRPPAERGWRRPIAVFHRACRGSRTATARWR